MRTCLAIVGSLLLPAALVAQSAGTPVPRPFPGSGAPPATTGAKPPVAAPAQTAAPAPAPAAPSVPTGPVSCAVPASLGVPMYPSAQFLESFDAGSGQTYCIFGTNAPYLDIVTFYKSALKTNGREIYKAPAMQQFDLGRFQEETMAYPPSVVVKDYTWNNSEGYLFVSGTKEIRYRTIIQVVPTAPVAATR
jgi:hypothetical protein